MRGLLAAGCLVLVLAWPEAPSPRPLRLAAPAADAKRPIALVWSHGRTRLAPLDEDTLRVGKRRSEPLGIVDAWAFSPGGERILIAAHGYDDRQSPERLRTFDVSSLRRRAGAARLGGRADALLWRRPDRVVAVVENCCAGGAVVDVVDARGGSALRRVPLGGRVATIARAGDALVLLVVPTDRIGAGRIVTVDGGGSVRSVELSAVQAGWEAPQGRNAEPVGIQRVPALAVDPDAGRAYVLQAAGPAAEVDLATLAVSYHELHAPTSPMIRLARWLEPEGAAKGMNGPIRSARWVGNGLLALTGWDEQVVVSPNGDASLPFTPAGLAIVDAHDWSVRMLDPRADVVTVADGLLLATGSFYSSDADKTIGIGVVAYGTDRSRRFELFPGEPSWVDLVLHGRAYVDEGRVGETRIAVVDLGSGEVVAERTKPVPLPLLVDGPDN